MALDFYEKKTLENGVDIVLLNSQMATANGDITGLAGVGRTTETVKANADAIVLVNAALAERSNYLSDTTQTVTFNEDDTIASIVHTDAGSNVIRTDTFTYGANTITEVRTLAGGATFTIIFHTDTYVTEVI